MTTHLQQTRVSVRVDSHVHGQIDLSNDCVGFQTQKTTKARGRWKMTLVPRRNYLNLLAPNDVINIYVDPGDGERGRVRLMAGYIDRVDREEAILDEYGKHRTRFQITGSDFQKAIDQTSIYFNQFLRQVIDERFVRTSTGEAAAQGNIGGAAMRNAGITAYGTPADFVENMLLILLGFGQQWQLPASYAEDRQSIKKNRARRVQRAKDKIPENVIEAAGTMLNFAFNRENLDEFIDEILETAQSIGFQDPASEDKQTLEQSRKKIEAAKTLRQSSALLAFRTVLETADDSYPAGIIDLLDFDFIEALAIDGFQANTTVWQAGNQTLGQFVYGHSNEFVNELIFDLRPVSQGGGGLEEGLYSRGPDELGMNQQKGLSGGVDGVQYRPAVVFREYPYSTVDTFNTQGLTFVAPGVSQLDVDFPDRVFFGPVFTKNPNVFGRHTYTYPAPISPSKCRFAETMTATKHIDAIVVRNEDVEKATLGRSDDDVFNLLSIYPRNMGDLAKHYKGMATNYSPLLNQISVARNGLRTRELTTEFSRYARDVECGVTGGKPSTNQTRRNLLRWHLLLDHWYQHNTEYLSGTISLRGMPEIRVGYRLDWEDRHESYYVESVSHMWQYPGALRTNVSVSRGQRNDPFPSYVPPVFLGSAGEILAKASGDRSAEGRLADYFRVRDTHATLSAADREPPFEDDENFIDSKSARFGGNIIYPATSSPVSDQLPEGEVLPASTDNDDPSGVV